MVEYGTKSVREPSIRTARDAARWIGAAACLAVVVEGAAMMIRAMSITRSFVAGLAFLAFGLVVGSILLAGGRSTESTPVAEPADGNPAHPTGR